MEVFEIDKLNLPVCPYCRAEAGYLEAFEAKNKSSYQCRKCGGISTVLLRSIMFKTLEIAEILSLIIAAIAIFQGGGYCLVGLIFITLIFVAFYIFSPFMFMLSPYDFELEDEKGKHKKKNIEVEKQSGEDTNEEIFSN